MFAIASTAIVDRSVIAAVTISDSEYEARPHFKVATENATYYFDRAGGGFSRVLDRDGNDWVAFHRDPLKVHPASAAAGYRGIPNLLFGRDNPDAGRSNNVHQSIAKTAQSWLVSNKGALASAQKQSINVSDEILFGDLDCFRIETPSATYLYGKRGAGFASILDPQGNDWISYRHGNKAAGEYRGMPKNGQPTKFFHCGYGYGQYTNTNPFESKVTEQTPEHVRVHSETLNSDSACDWDFYENHATLTLTKIGQEKYWFLYEGTPGGKLEPERDFVVRPGNRKSFLNENWVDNVPWVYFGASESNASLFLIDHQRDLAPESYVSWPYAKDRTPDKAEMTVFGFGRPGWQDPAQHTPPMSKLPARFSIGFNSTQDYAAIEKQIEKISTDIDAKNKAAAWRGPQPVEGKPWPSSSHFYHRYWFQMGDELANAAVNDRFRVNDPYAATHPSFHARKEPKGNGMMLVPMEQPLREIDAARLYLELWGGHPHTDHRRVTVNGRTTYSIDVPINEQCTHAYREIGLKLTDLVRGQNALQFAVDGDQTFWGHFIVDEAAIDALLPATSPELQSLVALAKTPPTLQVDSSGDETFELTLAVDSQAAAKISSVHYYAKYEGFDENGDGVSNDWHGMTKRKIPVGHIGSSDKSPYSVRWDVSMLKAQEGVKVKAVIEFVNDADSLKAEEMLREKGQRYWKAHSLLMQTDVVTGLKIQRPAGVQVAYIPSINLSVPMWSRANRRKTCDFELTIDPKQIERGQLDIAIWDGGAGTIQNFFQLNGHPLSIAKNGRHDAIYSQVPIEPSWMQLGKNQAELLSDTEHHGIEVLHPGPMLTIRYKTN